MVGANIRFAFAASYRGAKNSQLKNHAKVGVTFFACLGLTCGLSAVSARADVGMVTKKVSGCDCFLVETPKGFVVAE